MSENDTYIIRNMTQNEVSSIALNFAKHEGWNPGLHDGPCFYAIDPKGFFVGLLNGEPITCLSAVKYDDNFGFIGLYIVKEEFRGHGYGLKIWEKGIEYLKDTKNIGLDAVVSAQDKYKKSGFEVAYSNTRFVSVAKPAQEKYSEINKLSEVPFEKIIEYDSQVFPVDRSKFLLYWLNQPESLALCAYDNENVSGYGLIRKCFSGYKIGPLFADSKEVADKLFISLQDFAKPGEKIFLDVPETNVFASAFVDKHKLEKVFVTARMFTYKKTKIEIQKIFGVTTIEVG